MSKQLSEQEVLDKLGIESFRKMTKDKVMSFASMMSQMDPAVVQKAIEQFPAFANMTLEALRDYKSVLDKNLDKNDASTQRCYDIWQTMTDTLAKCLEDDDITFEERKYYIEKMGEIADKASAKDTENKQFIKNIITAGGVALGLGLGAVVVFFGGKFDFHFPSKKE
jgi:hypothetical protein